MNLLVKDNTKEEEAPKETEEFLEEFKEKNKMGVPDYVMNVAPKQQ